MASTEKRRPYLSSGFVRFGAAAKASRAIWPATLSGAREVNSWRLAAMHFVWFWPIADTPAGDSRGSFRGESGH